jgi:membrane protein YqaA with SNARE-associated domain
MSSTTVTTHPKGTKSLLKRIMDTCKGPNAMPALFTASFLESSLLPVPIDLIMAPVCLAQPRKLWQIALVGACGSVCGALLAYALGALAYEFAGQWLVGIWGKSDAFVDFQNQFASEGWKAVAIAGVTPIPFKFSAILAGTVAMPLQVFIGISFAVRLFRFFIIALVMRTFGQGFRMVTTKYSRTATTALILTTIAAMLLLPVLVDVMSASPDMIIY